jgi:hypothetical protein
MREALEKYCLNSVSYSYLLFSIYCNSLKSYHTLPLNIYSASEKELSIYLTVKKK